MLCSVVYVAASKPSFSTDVTRKPITRRKLWLLQFNNSCQISKFRKTPKPKTDLNETMGVRLMYPGNPHREARNALLAMLFDRGRLVGHRT